ncbi:ABC transporter permease [Marinoscillum sp.]|uniref:ABC transporter permease n=1 Tax=Marinoscillum sp. TaxID=2024838 RepID=UPI003BAD0128
MNPNRPEPPKWALRFFRWYCRGDRQEELEGDLLEMFYASLNARNLTIANLLFWYNVMRCFRGYAWRKEVSEGRFWNYSIFINSLKVIRRNFKHHRLFSLLNISGLAIGFAAVLLIVIYLHFETSFENFHGKSERIYRLTVHYTSPNGYDTHFARVDADWINDIPNSIPEVEHLIRFQNQETRYVQIGEHKFRQENAFSTDGNVFDVFDFELLSGDPKSALRLPYSVVISEALAEKYFPDGNAMGEEIAITGFWSSEEKRYQVTGIMKSLPANTHLPVDMLLSFQNEEERSWWAYTYLLFQEGADLATVQSKLEAMAIKRYGSNALEGTDYVFQPLSDIHLHSDLAREIRANGSILYVRVFSIVAMLILILVTVNFMNLSSALFMTRAREIGVRKVLGAARRQLIFYSLTESVLFSLIAATIGGGLAFLLFPSFGEMIGVQNLLYPGTLVIGLAASAICTGLVAGVYPAVVLSSLNLVKSMRNITTFSLAKTSSQFNLKRGLITLQFAISILLIASALIARDQFLYLNEKNLGIEREQVLAMTDVPDEVKDKFKLFKDQLSGQAGIVGVTASLEVPSREIRDGGVVTSEGMEENDESAPSMDIQVIDHDYLEVMGISLAAGEPLPESLTYLPIPEFLNGDGVSEYLISQRRAYLLNETAMRAMGWESPEETLGKSIAWSQGEYKLARGPVVGVIKDYHQETLKNKIDPIVFVFEPLWLRNFLVKVETNHMESTLELIEDNWNQLFPQYPFEYHFVDDLYAKLYQNERKQLQLLYLLSGLAMVIAFIGLFGLIVYSLKTRTREVAIRRVLGASFISVVKLISREYLMVLIVSGAVAIPLSYFFISRWLEGFAYRVDVSPMSYMITLGFIGLILLSTIALQTLKGVKTNPADILKDE